MSLASDNFTALIHLRDQARKWKNVAFLLLVALFLMFSRTIFGGGAVNSVEAVGDYIANISIEGIILDDNYRSELLRKIAVQKNIKAVIVNIDSPGGGIVGSEVLYENLRIIADKKPIVVVMGALAASGGYMASLASDHIIARNGTLTGSIGVIMQTSEITSLADKLGIKFLTYKSGPMKASPSPFEKRNPEVDKVINESVKDSYNFFADLVKERRKDKLNKKEINQVMDGRIFTGRQALKSGLVDEIGGRNEAIKYLKSAHNIDIDKIEVRDIDIKKPDNGFVGKLFGEEVVTKIFGTGPKGEKLMAIWNLN